MLIRLHKYLIFYNFLIAFCALALTAYFAIIFNSNFPLPYYVFNFFGTLAVYNFLRHYRDFDSFLKDKKSLLFRIIAASVLFCGIAFMALPLGAKLYYSPLILLVIGYGFPVFNHASLRSVPFIKIFIISIVWVLSASSVIFFSNPVADVTAKKIAFMLAQIFFFVAITLPFDIKDVIYDRIKTIPNTIGVEKSVAISQLCMAAYICLVLVFGTNPVFKMAHVVFSLLTLYVIYRQKDIHKLYSLYYLVDGLILAQTGFVFLFGHLLVK